MASLNVIERDVLARRHARQPFDEKYLLLVSEPMVDKTDERPQEMGRYSREVKTRAALIHVTIFIIIMSLLI